MFQKKTLLYLTVESVFQHKNLFSHYVTETLLLTEASKQ